RSFAGNVDYKATFLQTVPGIGPVNTKAFGPRAQPPALRVDATNCCEARASRGPLAGPTLPLGARSGRRCPGGRYSLGTNAEGGDRSLTTHAGAELGS